MSSPIPIFTKEIYLVKCPRHRITVLVCVCEVCKHYKGRNEKAVECGGDANGCKA